MYTKRATKARVFSQIVVLALLASLLACCAHRSAAGVPAPIASVPRPTPASVAPSPVPPAVSTPSPVPSAAATPPVAATRPAPALTPSPAAPTDTCLPLPVAPDRPRYRFDVTADPATHRLHVRQAIALADPVRLQTGEIVFNVPTNGMTGVFALEAVRLALSPLQTEAADLLQPAAVLLEDSTLRVRLPTAATRAAILTVCLDYAVHLPPAGHEGISAIHALGWSELGMIAGYWYPVLAPYVAAATRGGGRWLITPYHPVGDPIVYETADYEVTVRAPTSHQVIAAGLTDAQQGVWRFRLDRARGFAFAVSDRLMASQADVQGISVRVYHLPEHDVAAQAALRGVQEALPLFVQAYGPYPYAELLIVEAVQFGGMEYSALMTFSRDWFAAYQPPSSDAGFGADLLVRFVVHELGHQWWYGVVGNDQAHEPWLDEGLARYGEVFYYETLHPAHLAWWEAPSRDMPTLPINQPIYHFSDTTTYVQAAYVSSTRFWLDVRRLMGPAAFTGFVQTYRERYQDRLAHEAEVLALLRDRLGPALDRLLSVYFR